MGFEGMRVVLTGGGRGLGRRLAGEFAQRGAHVFVSARDEAAAKETVRGIEWAAVGSASAYACDLAQPASVAEFAQTVSARTDRVDVLINNGAAYLEGPADDERIAETVQGAATGTILLTEKLLPLLRRSDRPDVVNVVSAAGEPGHHRSPAHPAFYAAKHAQAGYAEILSHRLRPEGIRVVSLFPPDFVQDGPRTAGSPLTAASVADCVLFAVGPPRDCFLREFRFEQL
ncbi:NAD(P)-dependent dehydrogenase (short-subunit alcohol dehydrogenase family) [Hamadaea flava]|uniref:SDR family oxidoreductase n=1 Tax=Hamadaea flava TaxID=1742688 RepID=A0ABV8LSX7_9ACTN|nr:SDR family oxidoreductase [Hamadaea flava]MCP2328026.1 NAD(P)-dependent dehydrogenase (short-subunit alcohol dehydrogenase family) [Hamadaea flava]